ncbi:hypothetical protein [Catenuloplanes indicus]|uniref:Uncharacterized protein n=1 Tax=Catenuloplanes indicus TaxID=137267 RepID=A0AAE3VWB6_9ACTN|nr:hypothetical protein [Catenuloplanes indicus]MDQ0364447.1 hypothetical protein [Catenuloplanes indicus]
MPQLAFGVTSRTAVDAALGLAPRYPGRVMLIASRSQVEPVSAPGGYVEGWTSGDLVGYVRRRDPYGTTAVCRDHGGPWQHPAECAAGLSEDEAVRSSLRSLRADIDAGMRILHLDTSRERDRPAAAESAVRRLLTLYGECHEYASATGRTVDFEVGVEEQSPAAGDAEEFRQMVADLVACLDAASLPRPVFIVAQTGTKVVEDGNHGALVHDPETVRRAVPALRATCRSAGARLKAHNGDYLGSPRPRSRCSRSCARSATCGTGTTRARTPPRSRCGRR